MYKAVLIDVDNTLLHFDKCADKSMRLAFEEFSLPAPKNLLEVFTKINDELWIQIEKGTLTKPELHKIRFVKILEALNIDFDGLVLEEKFRYNLKFVAEKVDGAEDLLKYLKQKYFIGFATNGHPEQQINRLKISGLDKYADAHFISGEIGYEKPSKEFFEYALSKLPTKNKDEIIVIGDSLTADIKGGIDFNIKTCWFNLKNQPNNSSLKPNFTVNKLSQIKNLL